MESSIHLVILLHLTSVYDYQTVIANSNLIKTLSIPNTRILLSIEIKSQTEIIILPDSLANKNQKQNILAGKL